MSNGLKNRGGFCYEKRTSPSDERLSPPPPRFSHDPGMQDGTVMVPSFLFRKPESQGQLQAGPIRNGQEGASHRC
jgi:hypothetical protein